MSRPSNTLSETLSSSENLSILIFKKMILELAPKKAEDLTKDEALNNIVIFLQITERVRDTSFFFKEEVFFEHLKQIACNAKSEELLFKTKSLITTIVLKGANAAPHETIRAARLLKEIAVRTENEKLRLDIALEICGIANKKSINETPPAKEEIKKLLQETVFGAANSDPAVTLKSLDLIAKIAENITDINLLTGPEIVGFLEAIASKNPLIIPQVAKILITLLGKAEGIKKDHIVSAIFTIVGKSGDITINHLFTPEILESLMSNMVDKVDNNTTRLVTKKIVRFLEKFAEKNKDKVVRNILIRAILEMAEKVGDTDLLVTPEIVKFLEKCATGGISEEEEDAIVLAIAQITAKTKDASLFAKQKIATFLTEYARKHEGQEQTKLNLITAIYYIIRRSGDINPFVTPEILTFLTKCAIESCRAREDSEVALTTDPVILLILYKIAEKTEDTSTLAKQEIATFFVKYAGKKDMAQGADLMLFVTINNIIAKTIQNKGDISAFVTREIVTLLAKVAKEHEDGGLKDVALPLFKTIAEIIKDTSPLATPAIEEFLRAELLVPERRGLVVNIFNAIVGKSANQGKISLFQEAYAASNPGGGAAAAVPANTPAATAATAAVAMGVAKESVPREK